jgi:peptidylprolyl isomerase
VSQPNRPKKERPAPRQNRLPAVLSAIAVVAVFVGLGIILARTRPGATTETAAAPTPNPFAIEQTVAVATPIPEGTAAHPAPPVGQGKTYSAAPPMTIDPKKTYMATITTPRGDIQIKLRPDLAPQTVNSFVFLAKEGFYNGLTWHRVLQNFMAQGGDPEGTGGGGPGYTLPDEFTNKVLFDKPGVVAMAKTSAPNSAGSQFFITTAPAAYLNEKYTIFGEVTKGQEIVNGIPLRDPDQNPTQPGEQIVKIAISEQ